MAAKFGTLDMRDTTVAQLRLRDIGTDDLNAFLQAEFAMYNEIANELIGLFSFPTTEYLVRYGRQGSMEMQPAEEYSRMNLQRLGLGYSLGLPLTRWQIGIGWTRDFFRRKTVQDLTLALDAQLGADTRNNIREIKRALFGSTNYTFADELKGDLAVKRLINADSTPIPPYDGATFDGSTHTHYLYTDGATIAAADATAIQNHLTEHGHDGNLVMYINPAQEAVVRLLSTFTAAQSPFLIQPTTTVALVSNASDYRHVIGRVGAMEVRMRNWVPAGYFLAFNEYGVNSPLNPLARRLSDIPEDNDFHLVGEDDRFPLHAQWSERYIGFGGWNRTNGVIMYQDAGNGNAYVVPTFS
jgi:hypothetical protein